MRSGRVSLKCMCEGIHKVRIGKREGVFSKARIYCFSDAIVLVKCGVYEWFLIAPAIKKTKYC